MVAVFLSTPKYKNFQGTIITPKGKTDNVHSDFQLYEKV